jgi:hypothetical protein
MGVAVTGWIAWFGWGLEFDKGARRLTGAFESDVGPSRLRKYGGARIREGAETLEQEPVRDCSAPLGAIRECGAHIQ